MIIIPAEVPHQQRERERERERETKCERERENKTLTDRERERERDRKILHHGIRLCNFLFCSLVSKNIKTETGKNKKKVFNFAVKKSLIKFLSRRLCQATHSQELKSFVGQ